MRTKMGNGPRLQASLVRPFAESVRDSMAELSSSVTICGSLRRGDDTVGDVDIVMVDADREKVVEMMAERFSAVVKDGVTTRPRIHFSVPEPVPGLKDVDIWVVDSQHLGAALLYCTGPGIYNTIMRRYARFKGIQLRVAGIRKDENDLPSATEQDCYESIGWKYSPPSERSFWPPLVVKYLNEMEAAGFDD